jgi:Fe-S-cluster containining protein
VVAPFPCTACGACCVVLPRLVKGWPLREDGACAHLSNENLCTIYETRPDICRVGATTLLGLTPPEYYALTAKRCGEMQESLGLDVRYRVVLDIEREP